MIHHSFHSASVIGILTLAALTPPATRGAELAMGFRVGEVRQESALVWTRVTQFAERRKVGIKEPARIEPQSDAFTPYATAIEEREGAVPGAPGQVRVIYSPRIDSAESLQTSWFDASEANDYCVHVPLAKLLPGVRYEIAVEARDDERSPVSVSRGGSFATSAPADQWQDVRCGIVTCQSYWHLDHPDGFQIYPVLERLDVDFLAATGDSVYLDIDAPRARTMELARYHWQRMYSLPRLVEFHRRVPGYWEVDDHDLLANDCWPGRVLRWMSPLTFADGLRVFREQNPVEEPAHRTVRWGQGLQIWLLDARQYRSASTLPDGPDKTIWGAEQREWLQRTLLESDAPFKLIISPTPIVGPDRGEKADNHANAAFAHEGESFRRWTKENRLDNLYIVCGDRHWQYFSVDPATGLREFACGPASDEHASGAPKIDPAYQSFLREKGGFLSVTVTREDDAPTIRLRHHDVGGEIVHEFVDR